MDNLLVNPCFDLPDPQRGGFFGWNIDVPDTWRISRKPGNPSPNDTAAECDQDYSGREPKTIVGWPTGVEARMWQDVTPLDLHSHVVFTADEVQHHGNNIAQVRVYGLIGDVCQELWSRLEFGSDVPQNTVETRSIWYTNIYTVQIEVPYLAYRLEFFGRIDFGLPDYICGWKFTNLDLHTE